MIIKTLITSKGRRVVKRFHPTTFTPPKGSDPRILYTESNRKVGLFK